MDARLNWLCLIMNAEKEQQTAQLQPPHLKNAPPRGMSFNARLLGERVPGRLSRPLPEPVRKHAKPCKHEARLDLDKPFELQLPPSTEESEGDRRAPSALASTPPTSRRLQSPPPRKPGAPHQPSPARHQPGREPP